MVYEQFGSYVIEIDEHREAEIWQDDGEWRGYIVEYGEQHVLTFDEAAEIAAEYLG